MPRGSRSDSTPALPGPPSARSPCCPWPSCICATHPCCGRPGEADLLQVLWYPYDHDPDWKPATAVFWRSAASVVDVLATPPEPYEASYPGYVPEPCLLAREAITLAEQVEIYFSVVQRKVVSPNDFTDLAQVRDRLRTCEDRYNVTAEPFHWKFNPDMSLGIRLEPGRCDESTAPCPEHADSLHQEPGH